MRIKNLAQIFIIITLLTGCIAKSQPVSNSIESVKPIIFIKHANSGSRVTITGGKLHVDPYGCIRLGSDTGSFIISSSHFAGKCSTDLEEEVVRVAVSIGHPLNDFDPVVHALQHAGVQPVEGTGNDTLHIWLQLLGKSYQSINSATEGHAGPFPPGASGRRLAFRKP